MAMRNLKVGNKIADHRVVSHSVENGVVKIKILVKRKELLQVLEQVTNKKGENTHISLSPMSRPSGSKSLEQRLKEMKRTRILRRRQMKGDCRRYYWRPALESIPEAGVF